MNRIGKLAGALLLGAALTAAGQVPSPEVAAIVAQSQQALDRHDDQQALSLLQAGFGRFPNDENLRIQMARVYVYQKHDRQAIGLLNAILLANPSSRNAKLQLAEIFGYRENYRESDRLYRDLLAADAGDEAAALGLIHNLILEDKKDEAREQARLAIAHHPASLLLQQYSDYLAKTSAPGTEIRTQYHGRLQSNESFFADTSGNRSVDSSQGISYEISPKLFTRWRTEETRLWKTGTNSAGVVSGFGEARYRISKFFGLRAGFGGVRYEDDSSRPLYSGDLDLYPVKNLLLTAGYGRVAVAPTFDAAQFDLAAQGWHGRADYRTRNFSATANLSFNHYTDGNHSEREAGELLRWFEFPDKRFSIAGGYAFHRVHFTKDLNHGYFSPAEYRSHLAAAGFRIRLNKYYRAEVLGFGGGEQLVDVTNYTPAGEVLVRNDFFFGHWEATADYSHYHLIQTTGAFRADAGTFSFGYRF